VRIVTASRAVVPLRPGEEHRIAQTVHLADVLKAPVKQGDPVGEIEVQLDGQPVISTKLVAAETVKQKPWWRGILIALVVFMLFRTVIKKKVKIRLVRR